MRRLKNSSRLSRLEKR
jgi:hypothetical protein